MSPEAASTSPALPALILAGCRFCDALNTTPALAAGDRGAPECWRCGSALAVADAQVGAGSHRGPSQATAIACAAGLFLLAANAFPMVSLELNGQHSAVTLSSASFTLWAQGHWALAAALFITTVMAPLLETGAMLLAALAIGAGVRPHAAGRPPRWLNNTLHLTQVMRAWNLTEVLVMGTGVALVKLGQLATLTVGPGLVALMAFMALRLVAVRLWSAPEAWARLWQART